MPIPHLYIDWKGQADKHNERLSDVAVTNIDADICCVKSTSRTSSPNSQRLQYEKCHYFETTPEMVQGRLLIALISEL